MGVKKKSEKNEVIIANSVDMELRLELVANAIVDGISTYQISQLPTVKSWDISYRQIQNYVLRAKEKLRQESSQDRELYSIQIAKRYDKIYRAAMKDKRYREATQAMDSMAKLMGLVQAPILNIQQNNLIQNNAINGNEISNSQELIELTEALAKRLAGGEIESNIVNALSD